MTLRRVGRWNGQPLYALPDRDAFGPSYVSDTRTAGGRIREWITWTNDCFDPPIYYFQCASEEEAWEHAFAVLGTEVQPRDLTTEELERMSEEDPPGTEHDGNGVLRYSEAVMLREVDTARYLHATDEEG